MGPKTVHNFTQKGDEKEEYYSYPASMLHCSHDLGAYLRVYPPTEVPFIYLPLDLREKVTFQSLARHTFTELEKVCLCDYIAEKKCADVKPPSCTSPWY